MSRSLRLLIDLWSFPLVNIGKTYLLNTFIYSHFSQAYDIRKSFKCNDRYCRELFSNNMPHDFLNKYFFYDKKKYILNERKK